MAANKRDPKSAQDPEEVIESAINNTEKYLYDNGKKLLIILGALVVLACGYLGYRYLYLPAQYEKAGTMMYVAEQQFQLDDYEAALNGDANNVGFLDVISKYGSTPQGNIARHYAGICYMQLGDMDNALDQLTKYKAVDGIPSQVINAENYGLQGDIYIQKQDYEKAAEMFRKAVDASDNSFTAPVYLKKLGLAYAKFGRNSDASASFQRIADEYPSSVEGREAEKYVGLYQ